MVDDKGQPYPGDVTDEQWGCWSRYCGRRGSRDGSMGRISAGWAKAVDLLLEDQPGRGRTSGSSWSWWTGTRPRQRYEA